MQYSVVYEPIEFQIPASVCSSILHIAVILKVLLVNLLAALNFANVYKNKKTLKSVKNVTKKT